MLCAPACGSTGGPQQPLGKVDLKGKSCSGLQAFVEMFACKIMSGTTDNRGVPFK